MPLYNIQKLQITVYCRLLDLSWSTAQSIHGSAHNATSIFIPAYSHPLSIQPQATVELAAVNCKAWIVLLKSTFSS